MAANSFSSSNSSVGAKLVAAAKADPKRAGVLAVLVVVLGIMLFRTLGGDGAGPKKASAGMAIASESTRNRLTASGASGRNSRADQAAALQELVRKPIVPAGRNLFAINLDYFPQDGTKIDTTLRPPSGGDGFWDQLAKSMHSRTEEKNQRQWVIDNLRHQAAQMKLQTILMGAEPKALIDGELVKAGDVVASFRVLKIEARRIIVEREGIKLEIQMK